LNQKFYIWMKNKFRRGMKKKLFIYGVGGLAEYAGYVFENDSDFNLSGFCIERTYIDQHPEISETTQVFEEIEQELQNSNVFLFIAVGNNLVRERIYNLAKQKEIKLASYISSKASTWPNMKIGDNCFIGEGSVIQPFVKIGNNSILFGARLGHHTMVGDHALLSGPTIGGNVHIGNLTFIGLNAV